MIKLTRLDDTQLMLNCDLISYVQIGVDTMVFMSNGDSFVVKETSEEIENLFVQFKKRLFNIEPVKP